LSQLPVIHLIWAQISLSIKLPEYIRRQSYQKCLSGRTKHCSWRREYLFN